MSATKNDQLTTPCIVIDMAVVRRNLKRMADYTTAHGLGLRPHTKTHKSVLLGKRQLAGGAAGLTVAKVSEAEVMLGALGDLLARGTPRVIVDWIAP